jgi:ankyrin repeat protein
MQREKSPPTGVADRQAAKPNSPKFDICASSKFLERLLSDQGLGKLKEAVRNGLEPNDILEQGRTPLMYAAFWNRPDACRFLIRMGARIDAKDNEGVTAYSIAKEFGNARVCNVLLEESARMLARLAGNGAADAVIAAIKSEIINPRSRLARGRRNG